jgi:TRAP-type mannitol/chloroaromatic compound transport system permease small subunit
MHHRGGAEPPPPPGDPAVPKAVRLYVRTIDTVAEKIGLVTMYLVVAMILILLFNAISRNAFVMPISWGMEMAQFILAAYYIVGGAYSLQLDLLYSRLSVRGRARLDAFTSFFLIFYIVCLLIGSISSTIYAIETNERRFSMWNPSMIPIKIIMLCGIVLMLLQAISLFFKNYAQARGRDI